MEMFLLLVLLLVPLLLLLVGLYHWNLDLCCFDVVVQTFVVACLMSKMGNGRPVELPLCSEVPFVENIDCVKPL